MTKDDAMKAIYDAWISKPTLAETMSRIREILDQIDQPQPEFTVRELVELLGKIPRYTWVEIDHEGPLFIEQAGGDYLQSCRDGNDLKAKLLELANLQPPSDKVTVQIDRKLAEFIADYRDGDLSVACREALKGMKP